MEKKNVGTQALDGRVALVTGGARGIGAAVAAVLVQRGARVAITDINHDLVEKTAIRLGASTIAIHGDVSNAQDVSQAITLTNNTWGPVDILVNSAGQDVAVSILDLDEHEWDRILSVNLKGAFLFSKAVLPEMVKRRFGRIINMSSIVARQGAMNGGIHYATTKAGLLGFTRTLANSIS